MQDKYVRRRRAVLAVLVAVSLILLTAYFGEAENSPLHSIQQGIVEVFTPIQEGASKVVSPIRDLDGWVSSTLHAKSQNKQLRSLNKQYQDEIAADGDALAQNKALRAQLGLNNRLILSQYDPVEANVTVYNPQVWYEQIKIDKGTGSGIHVNDPVLSGQGLVGHVFNVGSNFATVKELSSPDFQVEVRIILHGGNTTVGTLGPAVGNPTRLIISYVDPKASIQNGDEVVTAGLTDSKNPSDNSPYPPGIPIGSIANLDYNQLVNNQTVDVSPNVDLRNLGQVEILTKTGSASGS